MQRDTIEKNAQSIRVRMDNQENQEPEPDTQKPPREIQDIYVLIVREREEAAYTQVVDSIPAPVTPQKDSFLSACVFVCFSLFLIVSNLAFQFFCLFNPPIATVTIIPKSQTVTMTGIVQLGRVLQPLTISQSQTTPTTGKGHQDVRAATGTVMFYNGQQTSQTVAQGTVFTGSDGVSIETTQSAIIPPGNPNTGYGTVTVTAQAVEAGSKGNIQAGDVNTPIALAVFVKNNQFTGGQNARDFPTVNQQDINKLSTSLKKAVAQSMQAALQGQLTPDEQVFMLPCSPTVTSDHQPGQEAAAVNITLSETCSAVAYNEEALHVQATALLITQATKQIGAKYTLVGAIHVTIRQAIVVHRTPSLVFSAQGEWVYGVTNAQQQVLKSLIAGKTKQQALQTLAHLPGIVKAAIGDRDDTTRLPRNPALIHLVILVMLEQPG